MTAIDLSSAGAQLIKAKLVHAVAATQKQLQSQEARAVAAEQAAAALQQDVGNWQGRCKKRDAELANQKAKVGTCTFRLHARF